MAHVKIAFLLALAALTSPRARGQDAAGRIYHWRMNESNATVAVDSVSGRAAAVVGHPRMGQPGACGTAFAFDGTNDYLVTSQAFETFGHSNFTVTAWVRFTAEQTKVAPVFFINSSLGVFDLALNWEAKGYVFLRDNATWGYAELSGANRLDDGLWHCLAVVRCGHAASLYVDGSQDDSHTNALLDVVTGTGEMRIGGGNSNPINAYGGFVDEVAIYSRDLSPAEIADLSQPGRQPARIVGVSALAPHCLSIAFETWYQAGTHEVLWSSSLSPGAAWTTVTQGTWSASVPCVTVPVSGGPSQAFYRIQTTY